MKSIIGPRRIYLLAFIVKTGIFVHKFSQFFFFFIVNKSETLKCNEKFENDYHKMTATNPGLRAGRLFKGIREQHFLSEIVFCIAYNSF